MRHRVNVHKQAFTYGVDAIGDIIRDRPDGVADVVRNYINVARDISRYVIDRSGDVS